MRRGADHPYPWGDDSFYGTGLYASSDKSRICGLLSRVLNGGECVFAWMKSFRYTADLTDLLTLPTLIVTYLYGQHRIKRFPLETSA